jgi:hypothetical protein
LNAFLSLWRELCFRPPQVISWPQYSVNYASGGRGLSDAANGMLFSILCGFATLQG